MAVNRMTVVPWHPHSPEYVKEARIYIQNLQCNPNLFQNYKTRSVFIQCSLSSLDKGLPCIFIWWYLCWSSHDSIRIDKCWLGWWRSSSGGIRASKALVIWSMATISRWYPGIGNLIDCPSSLAISRASKILDNLVDVSHLVGDIRMSSALACGSMMAVLYLVCSPP